MPSLLDPPSLYPLITTNCLQCGGPMQYRFLQRDDQACEACAADKRRDSNGTYKAERRAVRDPDKWARSPTGHWVNIISRVVPDDGQVVVRGANLSCFKVQVKRLPLGDESMAHVKPAQLESEPAPREKSEDVVLTCKAGHTWTKPRLKGSGRMPRWCPEHHPKKQPNQA